MVQRTTELKQESSLKAFKEPIILRKIIKNVFIITLPVVLLYVCYSCMLYVISSLGHICQNVRCLFFYIF